MLKFFSGAMEKVKCARWREFGFVRHQGELFREKDYVLGVIY